MRCFASSVLTLVHKILTCAHILVVEVVHPTKDPMIQFFTCLMIQHLELKRERETMYIIWFDTEVTQNSIPTLQYKKVKISCVLENICCMYNGALKDGLHVVDSKAACNLFSTKVLTRKTFRAKIGANTPDVRTHREVSRWRYRTRIKTYGLVSWHLDT